MKSLILASAFLAALWAIPAVSEEESQGDAANSLQLRADDLQGTMGKELKLTGNVELVHKQMTLSAEELAIVWKDDEVDLVSASGNPVRLRQLSVEGDTLFEARADKLEFRMSEQTLELSGNAQFTRRGNRVEGEKIRYDISRDELSAEADASTDGDQVEILWQEDED